MNTAERKIFNAHQLAGSYCNQGSSPTEALVKVANDVELNPEMVRRVSEMLNVSLTRNFLKSASDKTSTFPLADAESAIKQVFTETTNSKVAAVDWGSSEGSFTVEAIYSNDAPFSFSKTASVKPTGNLADLVRQAEGAKGQLRLEISKLAQDQLSSETRALDHYTRLVGHFTQSHNTSSYATFENQSFMDYGDKVAGILDHVFAHLPENTERGDTDYSKEASYFEPSDANRLFDALILETHTSATIVDALHAKRAELRDFESKIEQYYLHALGGAQKKASSALSLLDFKKKADLSVGLPFANPLEAAIGAHNTQSAGSYATGLEKEQEGLYKRPKDEADMEVDNIRRQAILAELMSNDDVISGQQPEHVRSAYETLLQISPKSTLHREVVRSVLRNATAQQAVDPFTAKQLSDLEGQHLKNKALSEGKLPAPGL